jgi:xanthine dehydrogenase accessory factor
VAGGAPSRLLEYDMRGADGDADMICGGVQMILVEQIMPSQADLFSEALSCLDRGGQGLWLIDITRPDAPQRKFGDLAREIASITGQDLSVLLRRRVTRLIQSEGRSLVVDPLPQNGTVVLLGGGHVSREVARLAEYVDFGVVVCDDREEFASQDRFPMARRIHVLPGFADIAHTIALHEECYLLILTRGHSYDQVVLAQALRSRARYIGMIGSRKKRDRVYANLRQEGFGEADFARVHCPVGMAIGSESPREIGISIVGELIAARAGAL